LDESQSALEEGGERWWQAEIYRLKGELLLRQPNPQTANQKQAEDYFRRAHRIAREQQAKSLELRASMSLCRLWRSQDQSFEARQILTESYGWFTEGFDTADLRDARNLLDQLSGC
jgi:predicted ATPase